MPKMGKSENKNMQNLREDSLKDLVLSVYTNNANRSLNYKQIARILGIKDQKTRAKLPQIMNTLKKDGLLEEVQIGKFKMKHKAGYIRGRVKFSRRGYASIITNDIEDEVMISWKHLNTAMHDDIVRVELYAKRRASYVEGEVVEIIERRKEDFVGIIERTDSFGFLIPDGKYIPFDIFIPAKHMHGAQNGDKAGVKIMEWPKRSKSPVGKVMEVLGKPGDNEVEMHSIMLEYNLPFHFSKKVLKAAEEIPSEITKKDISARRDFRGLHCFTIDPADAKDFDDALSYRKLKNGNAEIGIHIADVTHYVKEDSILDKEAIRRATSIYLVDRVVPMLPERLSNEICSLRPDEDKLCFSAVFEMSPSAKVAKEWFGKSIIRSQKRFSYAEAQEIIDGKEGALAHEIHALQDLAAILRKTRYAKGAFNFERDEVKFKLDDDKKPVGVYFKKMLEANWLIEEFMLLANRRVAASIGKNKAQKRTFVYRVHDEPNEEKLQNFSNFIKRFGYKLNKTSNKTLANSVNKLMTKVRGKPEQHVVENLAIRSMAKAEYSTQNIGHYGLSFDHYTHFTSPIRRYPDVMVHRLLQHYLNGGKSVSEDIYENLCRHSSEMEQKAVSAERSSVKYKQAEFLRDKVGEEYEGVISGIVEWGIFVELKDNACEGLVHIQNMRDDYYRYEEKNYCLVGRHTKNRYELGAHVKVRIASVDMERKQVDLDLLS